MVSNRLACVSVASMRYAEATRILLFRALLAKAAKKTPSRASLENCRDFVR